MINLILLAAATAQPAPLFPPAPKDHKVIERIYDQQIPDPGADNLRLCVKGGKLCAFYRERKASGITLTIPFGRH